MAAHESPVAPASAIDQSTAVLTIDKYIDRAKERCGLTSDRDLCRRLRVSGATVSQWRTDRCWPNDETMKALAALAGMDERTALLHLNIWRTHEATRPVYMDLLRLVTRAAAIAAIVLSAALSLPGPASAAWTKAEQGNATPGALYIMENIRRWLRRRRLAARAMRLAQACAETLVGARASRHA